MSRAIAVLVFALLLAPLAAPADDYGPPRTVGQVRGEARRLLARQVRASGIDPKDTVISDVVVSDNEALLSWAFGKRHGLMGLVRRNDRWWDTFDANVDPEGCWEMAIGYPLGKTWPAYTQGYWPGDYEPPPDAQTLSDLGLSRDLTAAAAAHNADVGAATEMMKTATHGRLVRPIGCDATTYAVKPDVVVHPQGSTLRPARFQTSGYALTLAYSSNDAASNHFTQIYFRPPTQAEFLPNHPIAPGWGYADAVCYFDIAVDGERPVVFKPGTAIDIWFPFMLDDQLQYSMSFFSNEKPSGLIKGTIFDNTLHFVLPEFTLAAGKPLMAEIDGDPKPSH